jgi:hypothetical protein
VNQIQKAKVKVKRTKVVRVVKVQLVETLKVVKVAKVVKKVQVLVIEQAVVQLLLAMVQIVEMKKKRNTNLLIKPLNF